MSSRPDRFKYDATTAAWFYRMEKLQAILIERRNLSDVDAMNILVGENLSGAENTAEWLRQEIACLRDGRKTNSGAMVRLGHVLEPAIISDLAITMLEALPDRPGPQLTSLLAELLDVDTHRRDMTQRSKLARMDQATWIEAEQEDISDRKLAKIVGVSHTTVMRWRKRTEYEKRIDQKKRFIAIPENKASLERSKRK